MRRDSFGHTPASRAGWIVITSIIWAAVFDVFYNQHAHHFRFMLVLVLALVGTFNCLTPAWPVDRDPS